MANETTPPRNGDKSDDASLIRQITESKKELLTKLRNGRLTDKDEMKELRELLELDFHTRNDGDRPDIALAQTLIIARLNLLLGTSR